MTSDLYVAPHQTDNSGEVDLNEFRAAMNKLGLQWSEHDSGLLSTSLIASLITMNKLGLQLSEHDSGLLSTSLIVSLISDE